MLIKSHTINNIKIAEVISDDMLIQSAQDGLDLMGNIYYQGFDKIVLYEKNITPEFFDLKTKIAGEILQKFSNYRIGLAIVGDFSQYQSQSMKDFIFESNKTKHINFVVMLEEALENLSR
ncbi:MULTISPECIES: DUF4180 domain-containing protein [Chryseobacterium]|jgi:hypothetical protein|uniref:DUF4180 domain-containing protein n=1 Tax=Chryseobacterium rhizosphaerae TaxID=395937 RepID=A0AAE3YE33_9FLAO|nr:MULTISPECIES: DUF4180 domain-containing protein [Chryseobacterium]MBL3546657.1 DUF4180 domain-containing protein [Chryseobacterium sp. KMC2]MDC8099789.1 DUF4180 domain-containing protein [Chryseobacterium rhizosphaerae]MDR6528705.1 hypothetical protein [Chryseobacterium rhizosphaerae]MDR6547283.1 hypothetical protein [Chryseobacterium rhizosphaerae]REC70957.1 DUF4180 domain-containing protein [Chryseobacterium rhizosphaerae]